MKFLGRVIFIGVMSVIALEISGYEFDQWQGQIIVVIVCFILSLMFAIRLK
jgi:hypothetical protein